ncbi:MAG TPA: DUF512 domain-containing protein [Patescibacteria group bacterium]|nr:DUF512 domain-containing protein [Patescibacteria group bacterium]
MSRPRNDILKVMTYFTEIDWTDHAGGQIVDILPGSLASELDLQVGDQLLAINDQRVMDIIDVRFFAAEEDLELLIRRANEYIIFEAIREYDQVLGIEFQHPTFDIDIRRCNNLCEFCFVLQMAPRFRRTLYIKDDDYRYSFLFGHYVTLTNLDEHDWWKIETMGLSPLYVSVHCTDIETRRQFLRNSEAPDIMPQLGRLAAAGIDVHTQLVIVPEFNDGQLLDRSIEDLAAMWPAVQSISVVPVGITKHHKYRMRTHTREEARAILDQVERHQHHYRERFKVGFLYPTDEWYLVADKEIPTREQYDNQELHENGLGMVRAFLDEWQTVKTEISRWKERQLDANKKMVPGQYRSLILVTGALFANTLTGVAKEFAGITGLELNVVPVDNIRLGGTITVAGLLMAQDVIQRLSRSPSGDLIVLPRIMFDHPDNISLDDISPQQIADQMNCPVVLADQMGDVWDAAIDQSSTIYHPLV